MSSKVFESDDSVSEGDFDDSFDGDGDDSFWSDGEEDGGKHDNKKTQEVEKKPISKKLLDLKEKFGLADLKPLESTSNALPKPKAVTTIASKLLNVAAEPEVVFYQDPRKLKKAKLNKNQTSSASAEANASEMSLEQARHEVRKFGISGMGKANREEARAALAISLGAIPPKRKAINYKDLQAQQKKAKEEEKRKQEMDEVFKSRVKTMTKSKKKRDKNKVAGFDSQFGKFSGGVQKLSRSNIQRIKSKR